MQIFNSDGTEAEMCGNGIRCLIRYLLDSQQITKDQQLTIQTLAGLIKAVVGHDNQITVDMGRPIFEPANIPTLLSAGKHGVAEGVVNLGGENINIWAAGMGNPHMVVYVSDLSKVPLESWGNILENNANFPAHTNVHFVKIISRTLLEILVWERGSGATLACGTGACASMVVTHSLGLCDNNVEVLLPGGILKINWDTKQSNVNMTGPAEKVFSGFLDT